MRFRPCIDIHNGKVKQIIGGSLTDDQDRARENFSSACGAAYYADLYQRDGLKGGHVILLNPASSEHYGATRAQALEALTAYPDGLQIGGGVTAKNAEDYIAHGASHVIVTSYVFRDGAVQWERLRELERAAGREHVVIDLSCRRKDGAYYIVTDRWQKFTDVELTPCVLDEIAGYCDEFLVHGVDVEGRVSGMEEELVRMLGSYKGIPVTYAGGIGSLEDLEHFREVSGGGVDFTIGSALDLFGGTVPYDTVKQYR